MSEAVITMRINVESAILEPTEGEHVDATPVEPLAPHDRFVSTPKLCKLLDVSTRGFRGSTRDRLLAAPSVRVINPVGDGGKGRRWHLGDVVAFLSVE